MWLPEKWGCGSGGSKCRSSSKSASFGSTGGVFVSDLDVETVCECFDDPDGRDPFFEDF